MIEDASEPSGRQQRKRKSIDEIVDVLSEIADDKESGADRFRALKMLASMQTSVVGISQPLEESEVLTLMARLMKGVGIDGSMRSYRRAFPNTKTKLDDIPDIDETDLLPDDMPKNWPPRTIKALYRFFPEIRRNGFPAGYPQNKGLAAQQAWCIRKGSQMLLDRKQASLYQGSKDGNPTQSPASPAQGSPPDGV